MLIIPEGRGQTKTRLAGYKYEFRYSEFWLLLYTFRCPLSPSPLIHSFRNIERPGIQYSQGVCGIFGAAVPSLARRGSLATVAEAYRACPEGLGRDLKADALASSRGANPGFWASCRGFAFCIS